MERERERILTCMDHLKVGSALIMEMCAMSRPYQFELCQILQLISLCQLALTYAIAAIFFHEDSTELAEVGTEEDGWGIALVSLNLLGFGLFLGFGVITRQHQVSFRWNSVEMIPLSPLGPF